MLIIKEENLKEYIKSKSFCESVYDEIMGLAEDNKKCVRVPEEKVNDKKFIISDDSDNFRIYKVANEKDAISEYYKSNFGSDDLAQSLITNAQDIETAIKLYNRLNDNGDEITLLVNVTNAEYCFMTED